MQSSKPDLFEQSFWDEMVRELKKEDKWEEQILNAVMMQPVIKDNIRTRDPVFVINDNIRTQIKYWKDRRNDCVHHKDNNITNAHVEAFYSFLESNLQKITVEGGQASLLYKIDRHFDSTYTPINEDLSPLVKEIKNAVEKSEMDVFWPKVFDILNNLWDYGHEVEFTKECLKLNDSEISVSLIRYIKSTENLLKGILNEFPQLITYLNYSKQEIRKFWQGKIKTISTAMTIYTCMLRNNLIPKDQIDEANESMVTLFKYVDNIEDHLTLANNGFGEVLYRKLFVDQNATNYLYWKFLNKHNDLITKYIELYPIKEEVVGILCVEMDKSQWLAQFLQSSLNQLFISNIAKKKEFIEKATALDLELPSQLDSLA